MLLVEQDEGGGSDRADPPGAQADPTQRLEGGLEQRVAAFGQRSGGRMQSVDRALVLGQGPVGGSLDRGGDGGPFALVAQVAEGGMLPVGPLGQQRQRLGVGAQRGGVVLAAGPRRRGTERPAVGGGDDLSVDGVGGVLAR